MKERKNKPQFIWINCHRCGTHFSKNRREYDRQKREGRNYFYCTLTCVRPIDEFSPFRKIYSAAKKRNIEFNLSLKFLKELWEKQKGRCPYTKHKMILYPTSGYINNKNPYNASLDRIDSSKGYTENNVEFVCLAVNYAKNGFSKMEMINFFR